MCENIAIGWRDMQNPEQVSNLHPIVEVAGFVLSNKDAFHSKYATSVRAYLNHFSKLRPQRCCHLEGGRRFWKTRQCSTARHLACRVLCESKTRKTFPLKLQQSKNF